MTPSLRDLLHPPPGAGPVLGTWTQLDSPEVVDMLGAAGLRFTIVDCEHGRFGLRTAESLFRACQANGIAPWVRAPGLDRGWIGRALDCGAQAVVVPGIESAAQAMEAVAAGRFAPGGTRGACPCVRAGEHWVRDWRAYAAAQEVGTGVLALVETAVGVDAIEGILAVPGLAGLVLGPFDLSVSMGHQGNHRHPEVQAALARMLDAAHRRGVPAIAPVFDPDPAEAAAQRRVWEAQGVRTFAVGTDKILVATAFARYAAALRA